MRNLLALGLALIYGLVTTGKAEVLVVADEFPAMEVLAKRLKVEEGESCRLVDQAHLPSALAGFPAVVVYIHKELSPTAEMAFIGYARGGGRLVLLHHSISSGKRQNRDWFGFLGVELPQGDVAAGGYKWIEGVDAEWVNLAPSEFMMTNKVAYASQVEFPTAVGGVQSFPSFTLRGTEVYLNHVLKGPRTVLMGLKFRDSGGALWQQPTAGWYKPAEKGWVIYLMPGHSLHDFEDQAYGRIVLNAISAPVGAFRSR